MTESGEEIERLLNDVWALQRKLISENERLLSDVMRLRDNERSLMLANDALSRRINELEGDRENRSIPKT